MVDANAGRQRVFPLLGRTHWEAAMLKPPREHGDNNKPRTSESCVRRLDVGIEPSRPNIARHSFDSSWPALRDKHNSAFFENKIPYAVPEMERVCRRCSVEPVPPAELADHYQLPPSLNYTLRDKKLRIALFWCFILFDCAIVPTGLYFILWYDAGPGSQESSRLSANTVLSIVTATIGGTAILEYVLRVWKLWKKSSDCRVIGTQSRWTFDWFHWWFGLCLIIVVAELILGTAWKKPDRRLLALPLSSVLTVFGTLLLLTDILHVFSVQAPVRISSVPKGAPVSPGIYPLMEDICAVSGNGKTEFRVALEHRYRASPVFRVMLRRVSVFWALGALASAGGTMYLVFGFDDIDLAYVFGWSVPFFWAGIWFLITIPWVQHLLKKERRLWIREMVALDSLA